MKQYLHHTIALITVLLIVACLTPTAGAKALTLSPGLNQLVFDAKGSPDSLIDVVVFLDGSYLTEEIIQSERAGLTRHELIKKVTSTLRAYQSPHADLVRRFLQTHSQRSVTEYWIVPALSARLPLSRLESLALMTGLELVVEDAALSFDEPIEVKNSPEFSTSSVASHLELLNVPSLWARGLTGTGRLVCSFDTGVDQVHPALAPKWRGNHAELSATWFSKVSPDTNPTDKIGHGTHTMGIMVGSVDADSFGVAPDAEWISAGVIDQGRDLATTLSDIIEAFQWALDPDGDSTTTDDVPDVILNSWGIPKGLFVPCDLTFATVISNVEAAGIVTIFAAGNEGPEPASLRNPADMALSPLTSFAVGAVDNNSQIAGFSSRGPSSCDENEIKPEVVAPGVSVRSSSKDGEYKVLSGTSMAAPFIAGLVALMRQHNPDATVTEIKNALIASAIDLGPAGEDNAYGHGLVDASVLIDYLPLPSLPGGTFATHATVQMEMTISDFAQYGLAPGSIYDVEGDGFRVQGSDNLLYEAGIMIAYENTSMSSSVRDSLGQYAPSEFTPVAKLSEEYTGSLDGVHRVAVYADEDKADPIVVRQETISYPNIDDNGLLIFRYYLVNNTSDDVHGLSFGLLVDYDLTSGSDQVAWDLETELLHQYAASGPRVGLVGLSNLVSFRALDNGAGKTGFTDSELSQLIASPAYTGVDESTSGDWLFVTGSGILSVPAYDSIEIALALVGSNTHEGLLANANVARELYGVSTSITDPQDDVLPSDFVLHQNYPNPFNPTTNIAFDLSTSGRISLEVYNLLGRHVKTIYNGPIEAGWHRFEWDATDERNESVATGVYFYRLTTPSHTETRKMLLLK
ncbi:MAG: S8 family peptidase [candidate division Zixibacteria bacterium]|nr:S8 family peptidase [candidate division Zixibacteria bacterium]